MMKGLPSVKGFYMRARIFGYAMIGVAITLLIYYLFQDLFS
jgi:hypothetical protein